MPSWRGSHLVRVQNSFLPEVLFACTNHLNATHQIMGKVELTIF
jgi:hypothetical protein